jgi:[protein-PII] uridylyltransferase
MKSSHTQTIDRKKLATLEELSEIATFLREHRAAINRCHPKIDLGLGLLEHNTELVDAVIQRLFELSQAKLAEPDKELPLLSIVATGGYGRRMLAPYSDIDVTFIPEREDDERSQALIKAMFQSVMDVFLYGADMKVGYAYRLFSDLSTPLDHQTQTALLDARLVAGDSPLFERFQLEFRSRLLVADFLFQKHAERLAVLAKFGGDNVYHIEPNIKESAGGLRDAQIVEWFGQVLCGVRREETIPALVERNFLREEDAGVFGSAYQFLLITRNALHCLSEEARDNLTTEKQEGVASALGYADTLAGPALEAFMADYYAHAASLQQISRKAMRRMLDSTLQLGIGGLASVERKIALVDAEQADRDAALPFHACALAQAYNLGYGDSFNESIAAYLKAHPEPVEYELCGRVLTRILSAPSGVAAALHDLADQGALGWLIPDFKPLRLLIPYDAAHDYTVGEHSLRVVAFLERLRETDDSRFAEYRRVWGDVTTPEVLFLAALLHDLGKQWPSAGSHGDSGADATREIAIRLGWDQDRANKCAFLVRHHLLMAETSRLRDLRLDETVRDFTRTVNDLDLLNMLYLLTCADTNAVGEGIWTEMKGRFLSELYGRAEAVLTAAGETTGGPETALSYVPDLAKLRERIRKQLAQHNLPQEAIHEHTARMPAQYLLNTPLEEMYLHMAMINRLRDTGLPTVDFKTEYGSDFTEMTIVAYDDPGPGLLAKIVGVMYALDVNLHATQIFTRESSVRIALDTLWTDFRGRPLSSSKKAEVQEILRQVLTGRLTLDALFAKRKKPEKEQVIHMARLDDVSSDRYSLLEVRAPDEPGVVYRLSRALSQIGWNIHSARMSIWGSRVRAAFYITDTAGHKVPESELTRLLSALPREEYRQRRIPEATGV